jgi:anthranilate/para-aminobenzoate synthase component II
MKIAITQRPTTINGFDYDATAQGWYDFLPHHSIIPIANYVTSIDIEFDMLVISGGEDTPQRHIVEQHYFELALTHNKPILGVCHGAFFINEYYSGTTKTVEGHHNTEHSVFLQGSLQTVNSYHKLAVDKLARGLAVVARDTSSNVEAFKHKKLPIWGIVWHPERMQEPVLPKDLKGLLFG